LSADQLNELQGLTRDVPETDRKVTVVSNGEYSVDIPMHTNDVVLVMLMPVRR
jgi:xylan 1,4-beta-xylosidase